MTRQSRCRSPKDRKPHFSASPAPAGVLKPESEWVMSTAHQPSCASASAPSLSVSVQYRALISRPPRLSAIRHHSVRAELRSKSLVLAAPRADSSTEACASRRR